VNDDFDKQFSFMFKLTCFLIVVFSILTAIGMATGIGFVIWLMFNL
jgi:nitrate reductase NapE component